MLGKLFGSKARVKILKQFLSNPEERFYIRQLSRDLKLQLNSVRRELENLEVFGLLTANAELMDDNEGEGAGNNKNPIENFLMATAKEKDLKSKAKQGEIPPRLDKKYYRVNKDFVLFEEIKALIVKAQILYERDFIEKIQSVGSIKLLVLAGFFVGDPDAPVDILIVGRMKRHKAAQCIKELENELGREVNYTILDTKEFKYRKDITDVFLFDILERKKLVVVDEMGVE